MDFSNLRALIKVESEKRTFVPSSEMIQSIVFDLKKEDIIPITTEIGSIPEDIGHDSSEEKLYAKVSDIVLAKCFQELGDCRTCRILQQITAKFYDFGAPLGACIEKMLKNVCFFAFSSSKWAKPDKLLAERNPNRPNRAFCSYRLLYAVCLFTSNSLLYICFIIF